MTRSLLAPARLRPARPAGSRTSVAALAAALAAVDSRWLLSWLPGQGTGLHDHGGSAGAFAVVRGTLHERVGARADAAGLSAWTQVLDAVMDSRAGVALGFSGSAEMTAKVTPLVEHGDMFV